MKLMTQVQIGRMVLSNRVAMAPMTRSRATENGLVTDMTVTYYRQRATAGMIISEAVNISEQAIGSPHTPGIYTDQQVKAWEEVAEAVHAEGGKIVMQLWHTGRVAHSSLRKGQLPVAPSAVAIQGQEHYTATGLLPYETPLPLTVTEIQAIVKDYGHAASNAMKAGFDGVELHAAFGYLPNQFLVDGANQRTDQYGGTVENRSRFVLEILQELVRTAGEGRVGIKLSPSNPYNGMVDSDPVALYGYLIGELNSMGLAYLHLMQPLFPIDAFPQWPKDVVAEFGGLFDGPVIANGGYTRETAEREVAAGRAEMVSFGALYVANPDLVRRFETNAPYNQPDRATFYGGGAKGYIDYSFLPVAATSRTNG